MPPVEILRYLESPPDSTPAYCKGCNVECPDGGVLTYEWSASDGHFGGRTDSAVVRWTAPDVARHVIIRVAVTDGRGGLTSATTEMTVVHGALHSSQSVCPFELSEHQDGCYRPFGLGRLAASDPDGDALTYVLVSGDQDRFAVGAGDGVLTYVGPGEDFETGSDQYDLMVLVQDALGGQAEAAITVTVTDVNGTPAVSVSCDPCTASCSEEVRLAATAFDPDGDAITCVWTAPSGHFRGRTDGTFAHWIAPDEAGPATISMVVEDNS